ncbi:unnamed protein product, partial [Scytosiphon promiscuus]
LLSGFFFSENDPSFFFWQADPLACSRDFCNFLKRRFGTKASRSSFATAADSLHVKQRDPASRT